MEPVVNGLEQVYGQEIEFRRLDVNSADGGSAFRYYQLMGHPSYVIVNPDGQKLWSGLGELTETQLSQQITAILARP